MVTCSDMGAGRPNTWSRRRQAGLEYLGTLQGSYSNWAFGLRCFTSLGLAWADPVLHSTLLAF